MVVGFEVVFVVMFGRGGGYVPRLVATLRLPTDAARFTHVAMLFSVVCRPTAYRTQRFLVSACVWAWDRSPFPVTLRLRADKCFLSGTACAPPRSPPGGEVSLSWL